MYLKHLRHKEAKLAAAVYSTEQNLHDNNWAYLRGRVYRWTIGAFENERSSVAVEKIMTSYSVRFSKYKVYQMTCALQ